MAFHPQIDGLSEHKNQWVEQYLRLVMLMQPEEWTEWLTIASGVHNNRQNATTGLSPNQILIGYDIQLIPDHLGTSTNETADKRLDNMMLQRKQAITAIKLTAKKAGIPDSQYKIGDQVWLEAMHLHFPHQKSKLIPKWMGPFKIIKDVSPVAYQLQLPATWQIHDVFHASLLSLYFKMDTHGPNYSQPPPDLIDGEVEYEVEHIISQCLKG
jgi:hypothetical protein